jgi:hypothetical protein
MDISINTPALLFPAITLLMLAYTTRFLALANLIRNLHTKFIEENEKKTVVIAQLKNLRIRIKLVKLMQTFGVFSIFLCVLSMFFIYINYQVWAKVIFGLSLLVFLISLALSLTEINISTKALEFELSDIEDEFQR